MDRFVLGLDGGGTKTHCALYDLEGNRADVVELGPTNHEVLKCGFDELRSTLAQLFNQIEERNGIRRDQIIKGVFGMAGVDTKEQHRVISAMLREMGLRDFILCNDAYLGVKAGTPEGYGICVVNGTGCCVCGIDRTGRMLQVGGQGVLTGDLAGGMVIGQNAISSVYGQLFRCGEKTCLTELLFEKLGATSKYDFMDRVISAVDTEVIKMQDLNKMVFQAANMGDKVAVSILTGAGSELAASVNGILQELELSEEEEIPVVLAGSINLKGDNPALLDTLKDGIRSKNKDRSIHFIPLNVPPVMGAIRWALEGVLGKEDAGRKFFTHG